MIQGTNLWRRVRAWITDPVVRQEAALERAKRKGMARKMDPLRRALDEADTLGIQFYGERLEQYKEVLSKFAPAALSAAMQQLDATALAVLPQDTALLPSAVSGVPPYVITSGTLAQAYAYLTQSATNGSGEPEWMLAVTGVKQGDLRTLEHLIKVRLATQTPVSAAFDMQDFTETAITLHEHGQALHAIFHSHPFDGQPQPSAVDWRLQDLLDTGGYPAIQAVFSADGYVRFFARRPFSLTVSGKGVHCVDPQTFLYRLVQFGTLPYLGDVPAPKRPGDALRPVQPNTRR